MQVVVDIKQDPENLEEPILDEQHEPQQTIYGNTDS